ncbi:hypothetical protein MmiAt1_00780 [Methanimicrococcus sp. At1]|uniref:GIY-YIG domain-containing protein n=1 Tax=Methanimicrococcus hacksteinii TaxID=3028293 RepID=A0ABU3VMF4_9EURY|nr:hypothetical protein [Methanimicrococcus sp. At1]MDV0444551.1 hypothetical protein [Methanimicrococcus sp. At1]
MEQKFMWNGPFAWPGYETETGLDPIPDIAGVYLWTFEYEDGYLLYLAGETTSMKRRFKEHTSGYKNGKEVYVVLESDQASKGVRNELWPYHYSKNKDEFKANKSLYLKDVERQLSAMRVFVTEIPGERYSSGHHLRQRMEGALMRSLYNSKESWAKLADRGMKLLDPKPSDNNYYGVPITAENICPVKIYGLNNGSDKLYVK